MITHKLIEALYDYTFHKNEEVKLITLNPRTWSRIITEEIQTMAGNIILSMTNIESKFRGVTVVRSFDIPEKEIHFTTKPLILNI